MRTPTISFDRQEFNATTSSVFKERIVTILKAQCKYEFSKHYSKRSSLKVHDQK